MTTKTVPQKSVWARHPKVKIVAIIISILLVLGLLTAFDHYRSVIRVNSKLEPYFSQSPQLPGTVIYSNSYRSTVSPSIFNFGGGAPTDSTSFRRRDVKVITTKGSANEAYNALLGYMSDEKHLPLSDQVPGKSVAYYSLQKSDVQVLADAFILADAADIVGSPIDGEQPAVDAVKQHFSQSIDPVYGYTLLVTYRYK